MKTKATERLVSLDVMRGITVAGMILVNNSGNRTYTYEPLKHVFWNGLTPTDLVFPFFMLIMGISMYFSLSKFQSNLKGVFGKIVKRTILIFLVGLGLNLFSHLMKYGFSEFENFRILGVMQRLALTYGFGSVIGLVVSKKYLLPVSLLLLTLYSILLVLTDSLTLSENNIVAVVDRVILGESHLYKQWLPDGSFMYFDPEGLLSTVGCIAQVIMGFYIGQMIIKFKQDPERIARNLFVFGSLVLFSGYLLSYGLPINKKLWSASYVLVSSGAGALLLGLLVWSIDINRQRNWCTFFEIFGINPLYLYVQAALLAPIFSKIGLKETVYETILAPLAGNYTGALLWAILFVLINWIPGYYLYKKKIYIKL